MANEFGNWQAVLDELTENAVSSGLLKSFATLNTCKERIQFSLSHDSLKNIKWLQIYWENCRQMRRKSDERSLHFRNEGNKLFKAKDYEQATKLYTKSIQHAPDQKDAESACLAQGFGNRSAALYHLEHYEDCLHDITCALSAGYPQDDSHKLLVRKTRCLVHLGHLEDAKIVLDELESMVSSGVLDSKKKVLFDKEMKIVKQLVAQAKSSAKDVTNSEQKNREENILPNLLRGNSDILTQASSAITLKYSDDKGRYLVAEMPISAGDVLIVEKPFTAVLLPDHYGNHCHHCFQVLGLQPLPCRLCSVVLYCSEKCRDMSWSVYHHVECYYSDLFSSVGIAHLSLRVILTAGLNFVLDFLSHVKDSNGDHDVDPKIYKGDYRCVYDLLTHECDMEIEDMYQYTLTAHLLLEVLVHAGWVESQLVDVGGLLLRHTLQLVCNAHAITDVQVCQGETTSLVDIQSQVRIATAIYPTASLMNHSCQPTILSSFQKDVLVVRAVKDVEAGEEIFTCYGLHYQRMPLAERQQALRSQYFFQCSCMACVREEETGTPVRISEALLCPGCGRALLGEGKVKCTDCRTSWNTSDIRADQQSAQQLFQEGLQNLEKLDIAGATTRFDDCAKTREKCMYKHQKGLQDARDCLARCHAMSGQWSLAASCLQPNLESIQLTFGDSSIELAHELHKLSEILFNAKQVDKALSTIDKALTVFKIHYGTSSQQKELETMKQCLIKWKAASNR